MAYQKAPGTEGSLPQSEATEGYEVYEEEEEIIEEVTDDEASGDEVSDDDDEKKDASSHASVAKVSPNRVKVSSEVKNMKMRSPVDKEESSERLSTSKNPFTTMGKWTPSTFSQITVGVPELDSKKETTNDLTRQSKKEMRYWKAPLTFTFSHFSSTTMRFDNVHIPYVKATGYGKDFIYVCLPGFMSNVMATACKTKRPTVVNERSLIPDDNRWWKIANKVDDCFGIIGRNKMFYNKPLESIFESTRSGIVASVIVSFYIKAKTDSFEPIKPSTPGNLALVLTRGFITGVNVGVDPPKKLPRQVAAPPMAVDGDVADDTLMKQLSDLGL